MRYCVTALVVTLLVSISGCVSKPPVERKAPSGPTPTITNGGGFYGGDRPPESVPVNLDLVADAVPRKLPLSKTGNRPYKALGKRYRPMASASGYDKSGTASWYGKKFHGRRTSSGEPYDMFAMTAAHTVLPLPSFVRVTSLDNGRSVVVKVNDRGPFLHGRLIDLSYAAAHRLGITKSGTGRVRVVALDAAAAETEVSAPLSSEVYSGVAGASTEPVDTRTGPVLLQFGVFSDLINALTLRQQLRQRGLRLQPPTDRALSTAKPPYAVLAGPFTNRQEAEQIRGALTQQLGQAIRLRYLDETVAN